MDPANAPLTFNDYSEYFKDLAKKSKMIIANKNGKGSNDNFYETPEAAKLAKDHIFKTTLVTDFYDFELSDATSDNIQKNRMCVLFVVSHVDPKKQPKDLRTAVIDCEVVIDKLTLRMREDKERNLEVLAGMDFSSVTAEFIGPLYDNCYGYMVGFIMPCAAMNEHNPDDWTDGY